MEPGERVRVGKRMATFIRVVVPKRNPWSVPTHAIVHFDGNVGNSKIAIKSLDTITLS